MRILITADPEVPVPPSTYGGIERIVDGLAAYCQRRGHEVALAAHPESQCPVQSFFPWPGSSSSSWKNGLANCGKLLTAVRSFRPDILHSFSRLAYLTPLLPFALPKIMSYQRHTGGRQIRAASLLGGKTLAFTACSRFIRDMGSPHGGHWSVIPNFVELEDYTFVESVPDDAPLVFLSRIEAIKGADWAIEIAKKSGRRLILAGNRPEGGIHDDYWKARIAPELGKNGIEWIGPVHDAQKNELLGRAAALVVPIQWDEPFGIVFAEALACGTPVISCPRGALPEILEEGVHGHLIRCLEEGVRAVENLHALSRRQCRRLVEERYSLEVVGPRYLSLYGQMLD
jgi:glycosyltransferase involved in cell wall biosynthesis